MTSRATRLVLGALLASTWGCSDDVESVTPAPVPTTSTPMPSASMPMPSASTPMMMMPPVTGPTVQMDFTRAGGFFAAPFPSEERRRADGTIDVTDLPNAVNAPLAEAVRSIIAADARGFGVSSAVYFTTSAALAPLVADYHASVQPTATIYLEGVDREAPDLHQRYPVSVDFRVDGGPFGAPNLLSLLPLQGIPLRPGTLYAAVVLTDVLDATQAPLVPAAAVTQLLAGTKPDGMTDDAFAAYGSALTALGAGGLDIKRIAALAVFRTDTPSSAFDRVRTDMLKHVPSADAAFVRDEMFDDYCVYHSTIDMPIYQTGTPPFPETGGGWTFDDNGTPIQQGTEKAKFVVTIPRRPMPAAGYPAVVLSRTGAGGDRPLVDRGTQAVKGGPPIVPGTGPALYYAHAGFAGSEIDGPHGGLRNITNQDEQFLVFNITNPLALRDNVRQSAAELALQAHILESVTIDVADCAGATTADGGPARFDVGTLAIMGHSMGATISPLALAYEPRFRAAILSGAGGSWIENVIYKKDPIPVKNALEVILGLLAKKYSLHEHDPLLSMFQWAGEPADPPIYARLVLQEPPPGAPRRHVLMEQGIVDHYILPAIANATSLSMGLDMVGPSLDASTPEVMSFTPLEQLLDLSGRSKIDLPAQGNVGGTVTAVVAQHASDGIEDGHEVVFQTEAPKHQYTCFLKSFAMSGTPIVPPDGASTDPCP